VLTVEPLLPQLLLSIIKPPSAVVDAVKPPPPPLLSPDECLLCYFRHGRWQ
jgi:hypothetical protein